MSKKDFRAVAVDTPHYPNRAGLAIAAMASLILIGGSVGVHYRHQLRLLYQRYFVKAVPPPPPPAPSRGMAPTGTTDL